MRNEDELTAMIERALTAKEAATKDGRAGVARYLEGVQTALEWAAGETDDEPVDA